MKTKRGHNVFQVLAYAILLFYIIYQRLELLSLKRQISQPQNPYLQPPDFTYNENEGNINEIPQDNDDLDVGVDDYNPKTPDPKGEPANLVIEEDFQAATSHHTGPTTSVVTIVTGTHLSPRALQIDESTQPKICQALTTALHHMWSAWDVSSYAKAKTQVRYHLRSLASQSVSCILSGSRDHNMLWTFPMSWRPESACDLRMKNVITTKSYIREKTKVYVNWFLLRPDLVTFSNMASVEGVQVKIAVSVGSDFKTANFNNEGCPRFATILEQRDVYKQRLLLVALSDIEHQLERIKGSFHRVHVCDSALKQEALFLNEYATWLGAKNGVFSRELDDCSSAIPRLKSEDKSHVGSMLKMRLFQNVLHQHAAVTKTVFTGPRLVFVAGLEGVGHHVFAILGRKHTTKYLYESLSGHLCDSAWDDESLSKYGPAREQLMLAMKQITQDPSLAHKDNSNVFFLNTVFTTRDVNMYSYPWGGPRCYLKRYARVLCNVDIVELARVAEEAGVDFRVIWLKRSIGAAVVSASLHRPFGTLVSETRMLALSWALLKTGIDTLDHKFTLEINYEDMINRPEDSVALLGEHLGIEKTNPLYEHFLITLQESAVEHPVGDGSKWKEEVDPTQFLFMTDLLGL